MSSTINCRKVCRIQVQQLHVTQTRDVTHGKSNLGWSLNPPDGMSVCSSAAQQQQPSCLVKYISVFTFYKLYILSSVYGMYAFSDMSYLICVLTNV